ncbi:MAG: malate dehydrogenase [Dehalococcoidia bacterium]|nr:malate dehydrogenase [Dehalococcoidia bacterium]|tara:strand:+ start:4310 stop:5434 length:1125 start_codon:yes stop_codon:yes gene_type:complete
MLERFHVPEEDEIRVNSEKLRKTAEQIFIKCGMTFANSKIATDVLLSADIRGVDTHGVSNMLRNYVLYLSEGSAKANPEWKIVRETESCATIDCDEGLGLVVAPQAMNIAIEKAKKTGVGLVSMGNGRHLGMAGYHAMMALEHDMIGTCMTSSTTNVVPTHAAKAGLGTNPIAVAAPALNKAPFVFDAATSAIATNKVRVAQRLGVPLAAGWITDENGNPIMEETPLDIKEDPDKVNNLLQTPVGATRELGSHKGYSLGMVVDILGSILNGSLAGPLRTMKQHQNHFVAAYSIEAFTNVQKFKEMMDEYLQALEDLPPVQGQERVLYAGLMEYETETERKNIGIPLHPEVINWFKNICSELELDFDITENGGVN